MSSSKHVLFLTSWLPGRHHPTNGNFILRHAEAVASQGWKVSLLYITTGLPNQTQRVEVEEQEANHVFCVKVYLKPSRGIPKILAYYANLRKYTDYIVGKRGLPTLLHANIALNAGLFAKLISGWKRVPYVLSEHWSGYLLEVKAYTGFGKRVMTYWIFSSAKAVLPVSQYLANSLRTLRLPMNQCAIVPNVVDSEMFKPAFRSKDQSLLIHVSMLEDKIKNVRGILRAFKECLSYAPDARLLLVGQRPDNDKLKAYANQLRLVEPNFTFLDFVAISEVAQLIQEARALVLFSWYETLSAVVAEAQSCGTQVIASSVGGVPEACVDNGAILIPAGDEGELAQAMLTVLTNPQSEADSKRIAKLGHAKFDQDTIGKKIVDVYDKVTVEL